MSNMSNERVALQEQFQQLESKNKAISYALNDRITHGETLEGNLQELKLKLEKESGLKIQLEQKLQEMSEKILVVVIIIL